LTRGAGSGILSELSPRGALGNKALEKSFEKSEKGVDKLWKLW
jgi:hypothetical protein